MLFQTTTFLSLLASTVLASPILPRNNGPLKIIHQFPNETWAENLAVRSNGNLLVTLIIPGPELWEINPFTGTANHVYTFPNATAALGIAEYAEDRFAVNVGNFSLETVTATEGSWSVWDVDMSDCEGPAVEKILDMPAAAFLNGMAALPSNPRTLLLADSGTGYVFALDTTANTYTTVIQGVKALTPKPDAAIVIGVNGLQFRPNEPGTLYYTNSFRRGELGRIAIDPMTGAQAGNPQPLLRREQTSPADDFAFDAEGRAWVVGSPQDIVIKITDRGQGEEWGWEVAVNDTSVIAGPTACHFGRTGKDEGVLYVATNGGLAEGLLQGIQGGRIVAVDTGAL